MTSIYHAAIAASVLVGLMAVPAASSSVDMSESFSEDISAGMPDVDAQGDVPEKVTRSTSPDSFQASIKTAFSEFTTSITSDSASASIEDPTSELEVDRHPSRTEWTLTTSKGTLKVVESSDAEVEKVSTPYGELKTETRNGAEKTQFSGSDRQEIERIRHELRPILEEKKEELEDKSERIRQQELPNVEIVANESTAGGFGDNDRQHAVLVNNEFEEVNLNGWELTDGYYSHEFGNVVLEPRESLHVYTSSSDEVGDAVEPAEFNSGILWNTGGDTATLYDTEGVKVAEESY